MIRAFRGILLVAVIILSTAACTNQGFEDSVFVEGGEFMNKKSLFYGTGITVSDFYIGKYEVTQGEWVEVMGTNPSQFKGEELPVDSVSWYDSIEYCNKRSELEGLEPYYNIDKESRDPENTNEKDDVKWMVTVNEDANGYRLPSEVEWEYAASGGQKSRDYKYSGSGDADEVAWYWKNSGDRYLSGQWHWQKVDANNNSSKQVGIKKKNELGIYDMSGNVREWCWEWYTDMEGDGSQYYYRVWRGGGWMGAVICCEVSYRGSFNANGVGPDQGLRVVRSK